MRANLKYIVIGIVAFIFAVTASSVIGTLVNAIIPNPNKPDPNGKLEPDPQQKSKAEWLQQLEGGGPAETKETRAETTNDATPAQTSGSEPQSAEQPEPVFRQANPAPQMPARVPPAPTVGPGNLDAPQPPPPPPVTRTGPGNM